MTAYYNEIDSYAAEWLEHLILGGLIADGVVDRRDIRDVRPEDLKDFDQCHFFAGIGVWSYALRLAGWPDDRPVWTGSCPCQPFSSAGGRGGFLDERHLWPAFHHLIRECRPPVVLGEQVASKDGLAWLDLVQADLEGEDYAIGAFDLCAAGVGAPHIRQRLWFVGHDLRRVEELGDSDDKGSQGRVERGDGPRERAAGAAGVARRLAEPDQRGILEERKNGGRCGERGHSKKLDERSGRDGTRGGVADADGRDPGSEGVQRGRQHGQQPPNSGACGVAEPDQRGILEERKNGGRCGERGHSKKLDERSGRDGTRGGVADSDEQRDGGRRVQGPGQGDGESSGPARERFAGLRADGPERPGPTNDFWRDSDWLLCRDGRWRPVEPGTFPLAHGAPARVGRLRAYGNAIVAPLAAEFVGAVMEALDE